MIHGFSQLEGTDDGTAIGSTVHAMFSRTISQTSARRRVQFFAICHNLYPGELVSNCGTVKTEVEHEHLTQQQGFSTNISDHMHQKTGQNAKPTEHAATDKSKLRVQNWAFTTWRGHLLERILFTFVFVLCYWELLNHLLRVLRKASPELTETHFFGDRVSKSSVPCAGHREQKSRAHASRGAQQPVPQLQQFSSCGGYPSTLSPDFGRVSSCRFGSLGVTTSNVSRNP